MLQHINTHMTKTLHFFAQTSNIADILPQPSLYCNTKTGTQWKHTHSSYQPHWYLAAAICVLWQWALLLCKGELLSDRVPCIRGHCCHFTYRYNSEASNLGKQLYPFAAEWLYSTADGCYLNWNWYFDRERLEFQVGGSNLWRDEAIFNFHHHRITVSIFCGWIMNEAGHNVNNQDFRVHWEDNKCSMPALILSLSW